MVTIILALILSVSMPVGVLAQQKDDLLFQRFETHFNLLDSLIFKSEQENPKHNVMDSELVMQGYLPGVVDSLIDVRVEKQKRALKAESGLLLSGQTYYRTGQGLGVDPDENDALASYSAKTQVELRWNILSSSIVSRKGRLHELNLQGELEHAALEMLMMREKPVISNTLYTVEHTFSILKFFSVLASLSIERNPLDAIYSSPAASIVIAV